MNRRLIRLVIIVVMIALLLSLAVGGTFVLALYGMAEEKTWQRVLPLYNDTQETLLVQRLDVDSSQQVVLRPKDAIRAKEGTPLLQTVTNSDLVMIGVFDVDGRSIGRLMLDPEKMLVLPIDGTPSLICLSLASEPPSEVVVRKYDDRKPCSRLRSP